MSKGKRKTVKVTLRRRMLVSGKETLYLDYYPAIVNPETGKPTRREYLGMQVEPLKKRSGEYIVGKDGGYKYSPTDEETICVAIMICDKRQNEHYKTNIYSEAEKEILKAKERASNDFIEFFVRLAREKKDSNYDNWCSAISHLKNYLQQSDGRETIRFCDITLEWCEGFRNYLLGAKALNRDKQVANNTAAAYFVKFKMTLKTAYKYGYLPKDINSDLKSIKEKETRREFLMIDELQRLANTPCGDDVLKRAALFSALTGLRHSDILKLKWSEIAGEEGSYIVKLTMQMTQKYIEIPISDETMELCGDRGRPEDLVFYGLRYVQGVNRDLAKWVGLAGIERHITFHCFRHTYATLQLEQGTPITTIKEILGHANIGTTLIYAKTLTEAKREAANKIKLK